MYLKFMNKDWYQIQADMDRIGTPNGYYVRDVIGKTVKPVEAKVKYYTLKADRQYGISIGGFEEFGQSGTAKVYGGKIQYTINSVSYGLLFTTRSLNTSSVDEKIQMFSWDDYVKNGGVQSKPLIGLCHAVSRLRKEKAWQ